MGKKISLGTAVTLILIAIAITFSFAMVFSLRNFNSKVTSITERENMYAKFTEIDSRVRSAFGGYIDESALMDSVAKGYLSGINDPYAKYMNAEEYAAFLESSESTVAGVGITASMDSSGYMVVTKVHEGSTAASAGITANDIIIKVDDINLSSETYPQAEALLIGDAGTKVTLTVRRDSEDTEMEITRRVLVPNTVYSTFFGSFGYIRIDDFAEGTPDQFSKAAEKLISEGALALIFDVRFVKTGLISSAAEMIDKFAGSGDMLYVEYNNGEKEVLHSSNSRETDIPVVVIVNEGTAGAAEFFAAGLRDFEKAKIVGMQTIGFGSLQETYRLDDGSAIQLTVGKYYLANSEFAWEGIGITPDHVVSIDYVPDFSDITLLDSTMDTQLAKAIEVASSSVVLELNEAENSSEDTSSEE
ncbi:MAG: PDZ domain-containing protein [Oscillospiraceae bacterium]|nr:PDZ domain-containing protein [Oscillospiraceae bacterium]